VVSALGQGLLWSVLMPTGASLARGWSFLRVERLPTIAEWRRYAADPKTWRVPS
jgi:hypothetical protein